VIVLDTHVLIWLIEGDEQLGSKARERIEDVRDEGGAIIPAMSVWEVANLSRRGRVRLSLEPLAWIDLVLATPGFTLARLDAIIAVRTALLDWSHRDPADRMIVATALERDVPLMTADRAILDYAAAGHLQAVDARR
jgi:PIN domain nuclease of toxin-antitoxin system